MDDDRRSLVMSEVMTPEKANFAGNIHGGHLLQLLDRVAYACAARYSGHYVVTLSVDQVLFKCAIHVGELITCHANVNYVGRTSMEIGIKVIAENLETKPVNIKALEMRNDTDRRRYEETLSRKQMMLLYSQEHEHRKQALRAQFNKGKETR
jgi:acyl-CoA hydrolase